ncbi:MAG TPA: hypothetical protein VMR50_00820 [Myxococcota bacterium]|nr:hypothetical protein [Myxococcota bacterium]
MSARCALILCLSLLSRTGWAALVVTTVTADPGSCGLVLGTPTCTFAPPSGSLASGFMGDSFDITVLFSGNQTLVLGDRTGVQSSGALTETGPTDSALFSSGVKIALTDAQGVAITPFQLILDVGQINCRGTIGGPSCSWDIVGGFSYFDFQSAQGVRFLLTTQGNPAQAGAVSLGPLSFSGDYSFSSTYPSIVPEPELASLLATVLVLLAGKSRAADLNGRVRIVD